MEFTAENIEKAVLQFYTNPSCKPEVNSWLTVAQVSPQAWHFCWELMADGKRAEVQFFGASCLHVKISRYWVELPETHLASLRTQLCGELARFAAGPRIVLTRLAIALASFVLHTIGDQWPDAISSIISSFQPAALPKLPASSPHSEGYRLLLELLTILPEEFNTSHLAQHRKAVVRSELLKSVSQVLALLELLLSPSSGAPAQREQALLCVASWVQFGVSLVDVEPCALLAFDALHQEALLQAAADTLVHVFSHPTNHRYPSHIWKLMPRVLQLEPMLRQLIAGADMDACQSVTQLVVTVADQNTKLLLEASLQPGPHREMALAMVNLTLQCTAMPGFYPVDECCSDLPFGFWYNFQDDIIASEQDQYQVLVAVYEHVYLALVDTLLRKVRFPPDSEYNTWLADEKEAHRCYRQDIADTLMYAYNLLHDVLLGRFTDLLGSLLDRTRTQAVPWQELEAVLFGVASIAESVQSAEFVYLPRLFAMLSHVPYNSSKVVAQALDLVGSYAEWINCNPAVLADVMPLLLRGLEYPQLSQSATLALKEVVRENQRHLQPFVGTILQACKTILDSDAMNSRDVLRLMACLGYVLAVRPVSEAMDYLHLILTPHIQQLQQLATQQPTADGAAAILHRFNMLSRLFSSLGVNSAEDDGGGGDTTSQSRRQVGSKPVLLVIKQVLPVLQLILCNWISEDCIVESLCEMLKKSLRALLDDFDQLAADITQLTADMYDSAPRPTVLDLAKQLLIWFTTDPKYLPLASHLFVAVTTKTLSLFHLDNIQDKTDIVEAFLSFLSQIAKKSTQLLTMKECSLLQLYQAGLIGLSMQESNTVKASCQFLSQLIACGENATRISDVITEHGHSMVEAILRGMGGAVPRACVPPMADVLLALSRHHTASLRRWLDGAAAQRDFPSSCATQQQKVQLATRILRERVNKKRMRETVQHFTLQWRGMLGTEYAAQTGSAP